MMVGLGLKTVAVAGATGLASSESRDGSMVQVLEEGALLKDVRVDRSDGAM